MAQDTALTKQRTGRAPRCIAGPSGPGHRTRKATHRAGTPVIRSQVAQGNAHTTQQTELAHR